MLWTLIGCVTTFTCHLQNQRDFVILQRYLSHMPSPWLLTVMTAAFCAQHFLASPSKTKQRLVSKRPKRDIKVYIYKLKKKYRADTIVHELENYADEDPM